MADVTEPRTALERARFGRRLGTGDRFVGFWLELAVAGRNASLGGDRRNVARTIRAFFKGTRAAVDEAGVDALHAELRDAAQLYWGSCLTDPQYSSTLFGLKRLDDAELRGKIALEYAQAARLMVDSGALLGPAADLPGLYLDGLLLAAPGLQDQVRAVVSRFAEVEAAIADRLPQPPAP